MSNMLSQLEEVKDLVRLKHQQSRHDQSSHTPKKYGAGSASSIGGEPDTNLQKATGVLKGATTSEASTYEMDFVTGSGELDKSMPFKGVRTNREGVSIIRSNAKKSGWVKLGMTGNDNWHDPDTDVSMDIEPRGGTVVLYYSVYRPGGLGYSP